VRMEAYTGHTEYQRSLKRRRRTCRAPRVEAEAAAAQALKALSDIGRANAGAAAAADTAGSCCWRSSRDAQLCLMEVRLDDTAQLLGDSAQYKGSRPSPALSPTEVPHITAYTAAAAGTGNPS
jgi:hypothetical protein